MSRLLDDHRRLVVACLRLVVGLIGVVTVLVALGWRRGPPPDASPVTVTFVYSVDATDLLAKPIEPIAFTVAMITTEMPAAMRPYSIAVAPDSFFRNATTLDMRHPPCGRNQ